MSVTHLPAPLGATVPGADARVGISKATRRRAFAAVGILAAAAVTALVVNSSPGDASPASCGVAQAVWPAALAETQQWPSDGQPSGDHAFSQPGFDAAWATSGPSVTWPSGQPTVRICG